MVCGETPLAKGKYNRVALVGETAADVRDVMVNGESGLLAVHPKDFRPKYVPSNRSITWPNGATATTYNATEPDQLRGPQHDLAWADELAKWRYAEDTFDQLSFGLRLGDDPRALITTTPRPIKIIRDLLKDPSTKVTRGNTFDNLVNLAPQFIAQIKKRYEGTRIGRQELYAEMLDDSPSALWNRSGLDAHRRREEHLPKLRRVVIGVDPMVKDKTLSTSDDDNRATGIVAAGIGEDQRGYVLGDRTMRGSPNEWARQAVALYDSLEADAIVVETNNGGDMCKATIRSVRPGIPVHEVTASRGKWIRAEPVAAMYEQGRVSHVGQFAELEDEMVMFGPDGLAGGESPNRVDALVWALTSLFPTIIKKTETAKKDEEPWSTYRGDASWMQ